ncbi:MAG TPA: Asp-tRNA(Asn)/Glu-tRNA(Gln) amidotransferase GatCAB subunit B, partial [Bryobacteraceae bacterium]|nr:Asp-tRNA(Asn)/Glu-tRNA(Gln) amidotransferase GatCAB subunit B [Bryobacteraceae bacterium]
FPEPDLVPLRVSNEWLERVRGEMPELPQQMRKRFVESYGLRDYDAQVLTLTKSSSDYYEQVVKTSGEPRLAANWVMGDLAATLKAEAKDYAESPVSAEQLGELVKMIAKNEISNKLAKEIFPKMFASGKRARVIMEEEGLQQISDTGALEKIIDEVIAANPKQVEQYRGGKTTVLGFLVGQVMKASRGQASPQTATDLLKSKL